MPSACRTGESFRVSGGAPSCSSLLGLREGARPSPRRSGSSHGCSINRWAWLYRAFLSVLITRLGRRLQQRPRLCRGAVVRLGHAAAACAARLETAQRSNDSGVPAGAGDVRQRCCHRAAALTIFTLLPLPWVTVAEGGVAAAGCRPGRRQRGLRARYQGGRRRPREPRRPAAGDGRRYAVTRPVELRRQLTGAQRAVPVHQRRRRTGRNLGKDMRRVAARAGQWMRGWPALDDTRRAGRHLAAASPDLVGRFVERGTMLGRSSPTTR